MKTILRPRCRSAQRSPAASPLARARRGRRKRHPGNARSGPRPRTDPALPAPPVAGKIRLVLQRVGGNPLFARSGDGSSSAGS